MSARGLTRQNTYYFGKMEDGSYRMGCDSHNMRNQRSLLYTPNGDGTWHVVASGPSSDWCYEKTVSAEKFEKDCKYYR